MTKLNFCYFGMNNSAYESCLFSKTDEMNSTRLPSRANISGNVFMYAEISFNNTNRIYSQARVTKQNK